MSFFEILGRFFIGPLKLIFEVIFRTANDILQNPGLSIIFLSLAMNLLVLPLYRRADAMQEQARDKEASMRGGVAHIKKTFSGNERMMMLQTYYRQNDYSPVNALRGSISLLLEIPFFMAAYQFLSRLELLNGVSFGPIADLSKPDGLITVFGLTVNLLPVLMTLINFVSSAIYLRGFPLKTKIQLYAMAVFFLVFLYTSPSGLVFYWTLNNLFSLVKNIFYKIKDPKKVITALTAAAGAAVLIIYFNAAPLGLPNLKRKLVLICGAALLLPAVIAVIKPIAGRRIRLREARPRRGLFIASAAFLSVFIGLFIPLNYIAASPQEYVDVTYFFHPLWYAVGSVCLSAGSFLLWMGVFYWLASPRGKVLFERILCVGSGIAAVDYLFFGTGLGIVSSTLKYENPPEFAASEIAINILVIAAVAALLIFVTAKWPKFTSALLLSATAAVTVMSAVNAVTTASSVSEIRVNNKGDMPHFAFSKQGKNVAVVFLDRQMGEFLPYLFKEKPELKEKFDGFTYYSNVISFGGHTNYGAPPLMGGYEYTPVEMNKRDAELLKDKHNEALKVMPVLFDRAGYNVTVCDAPYANYKWIPDLSIYSDYPDISAYVTKGYFGDPEKKQRSIDGNLRNFFCFGVMRSAPVFMQTILYSDGDYRAAELPEVSSSQKRHGLSRAEGINPNFVEPFETLQHLNDMTVITESGDNFTFFYNDAPHEYTYLQEPDYTVSAHVDNTEYDEQHADRFTADGRSITVKTKKQMGHYHINMATLMEVGKWLDYLRENGVYDNTKIIIVADHGYYLFLSEIFNFREEGVRDVDVSNFFPLMMVKDFGSHGFTVSDEFMTNADVPTIAFDGCVADPVNPFTGKAINSSEKTAHDQFIIDTHVNWSTDYNNGYTFRADSWASVTDNIWDRGDWEFYDDKIVLKEHKMPEGK